MSKSKKEIMTDPLLRKSHAHKQKEPAPKVCPECGGAGGIPVANGNEFSLEECPHCEGLGVVYD